VAEVWILYQGTTLVGPIKMQRELGFSLAKAPVSETYLKLSPAEMAEKRLKSAGAKAQIFGVLYGPTKVVP
jgi:hypothetical protein